MEFKANTLQILEELSVMMHPNLGADNHTLRLIKVLYSDKSKLTPRDFFDLGKYYDRMVALVQTRIEEKQKFEYLSAVINLKHTCYGAFLASSIR
jgi:uncharacterized hydantoinase/oxoprolinase family protein